MKRIILELSQNLGEPGTIWSPRRRAKSRRLAKNLRRSRKSHWIASDSSPFTFNDTFIFSVFISKIYVSVIYGFYDATPLTKRIC